MDLRSQAREEHLRSYDDKYKAGGWQYSYDSEYRALARITTAIGLERGSKVLEIGCGMGLHCQILDDLGYDVTGNDLSAVGIEHAKKAHRGVRFVCGDTLEFAKSEPKESFAAILCRGHSWYHYELAGQNQKGYDAPELTRTMFELLAPGGAFILVIRTDFSGTVHEGGVLNNKLSAYLDLFSPLGTIVYVSDAQGKLIFSERAALQSRRDIVIVTRKGDAPDLATFDNARHDRLTDRLEQGLKRIRGELRWGRGMRLLRRGLDLVRPSKDAPHA